MIQMMSDENSIHCRLFVIRRWIYLSLLFKLPKSKTTQDAQPVVVEAPKAAKNGKDAPSFLKSLHMEEGIIHIMPKPWLMKKAALLMWKYGMKRLYQHNLFVFLFILLFVFLAFRPFIAIVVFLLMVLYVVGGRIYLISKYKQISDNSYSENYFWKYDDTTLTRVSSGPNDLYSWRYFTSSIEFEKEGMIKLISSRANNYLWFFKDEMTPSEYNAFVAMVKRKIQQH